MKMKTYMTIRQFRNKYGIQSTQQFRDACNKTTTTNGWRGLRCKTFFINNEYAYPVNVLKKIAKILGCTKEQTIEDEKEITIEKFKHIVPGLSINFAAAVAHTAQKEGIKNEKRPYKYPLEILIYHAKREGKEIPQQLLNYDKTEEQISEQQEEQSYEPANDLLLQELREIKQILAALLAAWKGEQA